MEPVTQQQIGDKVYTVWELAADHWWANDYGIRVGKTVWETATIGPRDGVRLSRLKQVAVLRLRQIDRWVAHDTSARLVPLRIE